MVEHHTALAAVRAGLRRLPLVALLMLAVGVSALAFMLMYRHVQEARGEGAVDSPSALETVYADNVPASGRFTKQIAFTCFGATGTTGRGAEVTSDLLWDDSWFFNDPAQYNHELARAALTLSTLAYSESAYYQDADNNLPYMENALHELGFFEVSTESYRYRSQVVDELLDVVTQQSDGIAYTLARKQVMDGDGNERELIAVAIRGSYGSEWLSNFNLTDAQASSAAASLAAEREGDHSGYLAAAMEIADELELWRREAYARGHKVSILLCGHSRGGAAAGVLAAMLDDQQESASDAAAAGFPSGEGDNIYAYTFASPRTTVSTSNSALRYANIFNILNPADPVTKLPLEAWGYQRYGVDIWLPSVDEEGFEERHAAMRSAFTKLTGDKSAYDPQVETVMDDLVEELGRSIPTADALMTPMGVATLAGTCTLRLDPTTLLLGHYPSVYMAWMQTVDW